MLFSKAIEAGRQVLEINCADLYAFNPDLYTQLIRFPTDLIPIMDMCINEEALTRRSAFGEVDRIQVRTFNLRTVKTMRDLNPEDIDTMICIRGFVSRVSTIIPEIHRGMFVYPIKNNNMNNTN